MISKLFNPNDYFTIQEQKDLIKASRLTRKPRRNYILILFLTFSYRRVSEILHVKVKDIDFVEKSYRVSILKRRIKTKEITPVSEVLLNELEDYIIKEELLPNDYLFKSGGKSCPHCEGGHLTRQRVDQIIKMISELAFGSSVIRGIPAHAHRYRKSAIVNYVKKKIDNKQVIDIIELQKIQKILKHKKTDTVFHYASVVDTRDEVKFIKGLEVDFDLEL